jgi:hypothetical protein
MANIRGAGAIATAGGFPGVGPSPMAPAPSDPRSFTGEVYHPGGFIESPVAGRTDHLPLAVAVDSHVIPADVMSGLGQGNSLNGARLADQMFHSGPWGVKAQKVGSVPRRPSAPLFAAGGQPWVSASPEKTTSIMAAGGEYIVRPEAVERIGQMQKRKNPKLRKSAMEIGHDLIDRFILRARKHVIETMKKLPGPAKR